MKVEWNKKYTTIAIYSLIVIGLSIFLHHIIKDMSLVKIKFARTMKVLSPFILGFIMAYLFNFILEFYEDNLINKIKWSNKKNIKRILGLICTYTTVFFILYVFYSFIIPQIIASISGIINNIPEYIDETTELLLDLNSKLDLKEEYSLVFIDKWNELITQTIDFTKDTIVPFFANLIRHTLSSLWNVILGVIVSLYLLTDKEMFIGLCKKTTKSLFSEARSNRVIEITNRADLIFSKFIVGKILDSIIIGILTFIILTIAKMPFTILVSFIIGLTNIIPFFGPFIGAIPSAIIIFFESPVKSIWFILLIIVIQQIDGNIIGPKILGDSLGISPFWILFSLLIGGKLFGFLGMLIGVPLWTLIYSILRDLVDDRLERKNLPTELKEYMKKD